MQVTNDDKSVEVNHKNGKKESGRGGIRTRAPEETGSLVQRLRPLGHSTCMTLDSLKMIAYSNNSSSHENMNTTHVHLIHYVSWTTH